MSAEVPIARSKGTEHLKFTNDHRVTQTESNSAALHLFVSAGINGHFHSPSAHTFSPPSIAQPSVHSFSGGRLCRAASSTPGGHWRGGLLHRQLPCAGVMVQLGDDHMGHSETNLTGEASEEGSQGATKRNEGSSCGRRKGAD